MNASLLQQIANPRPFKMPSPLESVSNGLALKNQMQTGQMNTIALQNAQQGQADQAKTRAEAEKVHQILIDNQGDIEKSLPRIAQEAPTLYPHYADFIDKQRKSDQEFSTAKSTQAKTDAETADINRKAGLPIETAHPPGSHVTVKDSTGKVISEYVVPSDKNIDPNSPEGIAAAIQKTTPQVLPLAVEQQRIRIAQASRLPDAGAVELTPEGLDAAAQAFAKTGNIPPMGNGKEATRARSRIINRAAELTPKLDLATAKADYEANKKSLDALQKQADAVQSFETTALKNITPLLTSAKKIIDSGSPLINLPLREAAAKLRGSPDQAVFNAALQIVTTEYAKIITNPNLSGQLSDSARHEVEALIPANATLKQVVAVTDLLKTDSGNRKSSLAEQITAIRERIKGGGGGAGGTISVTAPDGSVHVFKTQADADNFKKLAKIP